MYYEQNKEEKYKRYSEFDKINCILINLKVPSQKTLN